MVMLAASLEIFGLKLPEIWSIAIKNDNISQINVLYHNFAQPRIAYFGFHDAYYLAVRLSKE